MRPVLFSLALVLASVSAAQAQQALSPAPATNLNAESQQAIAPAATQAADARTASAPVGLTRSDALLKVESKSVAATRAASMEPGTRNILAIIGAVVVIIALVALLT